MSLIRVTTRKIDATDTEPDRIAVTFSTGENGTFPYPYTEDLDGIDAHERCIAKLIDREMFNKIESFYKTGETERGYKFTIFLKED
jgi:hypothetical protein